MKLPAYEEALGSIKALRGSPEISNKEKAGEAVRAAATAEGYQSASLFCVELLRWFLQEEKPRDRLDQDRLFARAMSSSEDAYLYLRYGEELADAGTTYDSDTSPA